MTPAAAVTDATEGPRHIPRYIWAALILMMASLAAATWLTPRTTWYDKLGRPDYDALVPRAFGEWAAAPDTGNVFVIPAQTDALNVIYSQIVTRTYVHQPTGRRIMLSLAYGDVQQGMKQLHRPESCYSSQGFKIDGPHAGKLEFDGRALDVFRMQAVAPNRNEQVTYWIRVGDQIITGPADELNVTRMAMGLEGIVADGLLFRVSEVTRDPDSDALQDRFVADLLHAVGDRHLGAFLGDTGSSRMTHGR
jgi:EpsI family protein